MNRFSLVFAAATLCLAASATAATQTQADTGLIFDPTTNTFTLPEEPPGGWQAFANLLKKVTPSVNTAVPLTPAQVTHHIATLIDTGKAEAALQLVEEAGTARKAAGTIGTDVQLDYQHARALAALGRHEQAIAIWRQMTTDYPELPEPWNALAIEYARTGALHQAQDALQMALVSDPSFAPALENLGKVQLRLAQESLARARALETGKGRNTSGPGGGTQR